MKKVCIVTAARSEYGLLRWTIDGVFNHPGMELQLVVTGAHLDREQGFTYKNIEEDGYPIAAKVDMLLGAGTLMGIVHSMGTCLQGFGDVFSSLRPDMVVVLGDRYELLPICSAALVMNIPIAHISGGDVTLGAIDNEVRNAITMMARVHFPGVEESGRNIVRMRGSAENMWVVGEPGLDNFKRLKLMTREELAKDIGLSMDSKWLLVTLHPETNQTLAYNLKMASNIYACLAEDSGVEVVISKANLDYGGMQINEYWEQIADEHPEKFHLYSSLGQRRYLSYMGECFAVIGNSSSGIVEAPCLGTPVINIGSRQEGRHVCRNVVTTENEIVDIRHAWKTIGCSHSRCIDNYYGDGHTAERIVQHIAEYLHAK